MDFVDLSEEQLRERREHHEVVTAIEAVLRTGPGMTLMNYLFKSFDVGCLPEPGLEGNVLYKRLGVLEAGRALFQIVSETNPIIAGELLAKLEKERYHERYEALYGKTDGRKD